MKILIVSISAVVFSIIIATVIIGKKSFDGVVADKPYETGLQWDKIEREKSSSGWNVTINDSALRTGANELVINISDRNGSPLADSDVSVIVGRPSTNRHDRSYDAVKIKDGRYSAGIHLPLYGYWDIKIKIAQKKKNLVFDKRIYVKE